MCELTERVTSVCIEAGIILQDYAHRGFKVNSKEGTELVTEADTAAEEFLKSELLGILPEASFIGEETWDGIIPDPPAWIVDPLDGTNNYAAGIPFYCISVALADREGLLLGCVYDPLRKEMFTARRDEGAWLNGKRIAVSSALSLSDAIIATGFPYSRKENNLTFDLDVLKRFLGRVRGIRRCGSAALDLAYTAAGRLGGFWEEKLNLWDMAAGVLLVREAGGNITGFREETWTTKSPGVQCSTPGVWNEFRELIGKCP